MDLKGVLNEKEKEEGEENNIVRLHKKPIQLRDIENQGSGNRKTGYHMKVMKK